MLVLITLDKHGIFVSSVDDQVFILSGGNSGRTPNESMYADLGFFVSGSILSKGSGVKGTSVFGGDTLISGAFYLEEQICNTWICRRWHSCSLW